ncbi:DUF420 domain-containing protein [Planctomicrobium sp. SH664]|uniref:DUF420 domain-containing protein n=1 Tax=Planctomicrobium sp. SH664 TaxID=3448125 RepID=UPI003F5BD6EB
MKTAPTMKNGFFGYDASFMLDFVVVALLLIVPVQLYSVRAVKRRKWMLHRNLQLLLGITLLVAVVAFEVDTQFVHGGWEKIVNKNPDVPRLTVEQLQPIRTVLRIHLIFAISTPVLWATTLILAWRRFPNPPQPAPHSGTHKTLGWLSVLDIVATSVTGLWFYYVAFMR